MCFFCRIPIGFWVKFSHARQAQAVWHKIFRWNWGAYNYGIVTVWEKHCYTIIFTHSLVMVAHSTYETTQSVLYYWRNVFRHNKFGKMLHVCGVVDVVPGKRSHILSTQEHYCKTSDHDTDCIRICQDFYGCLSITLLGLVSGLYALYI